MNKRNLIILAVVIMAALAFAACKPAAPATPSPVEIATRVASTSQAKATSLAVDQLIAKVTELSKPTNTPAPTVCIIPTPMPQPTAVPATAPAAAGTASAAAQPTAAMVGTPIAGSSNSAQHYDKAGKCYFAFEFLGEPGGVQTGSTVKVGTKYAKQWKLKNTGTCAWSMDKEKDADHFLYLQAEAGFSLTYENTNRRDIKLCVDRADPIQPGEECLIEQVFWAGAEGKYIDYWNVMTPLGEFLGYGPNNNWSLGINVSAVK